MKNRFELFGNCFNNWIEDHEKGESYQGVGIEDLLNEQDETIKELERENKGLEEKIVELQKALQLACEDCPMHCPDVPERYNLQDEYDSDEPYWVEEGGCEFDSPANCMECAMNFYKQRAKELLKSKGVKNEKN